jgi:phosphotransferase system enzyme I (PtsI)
VESGWAGNKVSGTRAAPGQAMGPLVRVVAKSDRPRKASFDEAGALHAALAAAGRDLLNLSERAGPGAAEYLQFQLALLDDETHIEQAFAMIADGVLADAAWRRIMDDLIRIYAADPSEYVRARCLDVIDLRDRVLDALHGAWPAAGPPAGAIVVAEDLAPSRFLELDWTSGGGIVLSRGSTMSHTAILARASGVPMIVQVGDIPNASQAILDADAGCLELDPSEETLRTFVRKSSMRAMRAPRAERADLRAPAMYRGERVQLLLNIEGPESLSHAASEFADGVGLMRTEFLFLGRDESPDEEAQFEAYRAVLRWAGDRPVTIRTVDAGGDKTIGGLSDEGEANPFLGVRGPRPPAAVNGRLKVMFPMVTIPSEFEAAKAMFHRVVETLKAEGRDARAPELGMMVEVPAAALTIADFDAAFFSIGANDLTQFVMACDRDNGAVSHLYDPMNPAVVELVRRVADHGRARGRPVSLCGDLAGDPEHTHALLQYGLRELSMNPNSLSAVKSAILRSGETALV